MPAADLDGHDGLERRPDEVLDHVHAPRQRAWIDEPLLTDQRRAHHGHHRDARVVGEVERIDDLDGPSLGLQVLQVAASEIGAPAAAEAEDPSASTLMSAAASGRPTTVSAGTPLEV